MLLALRVGAEQRDWACGIDYRRYVSVEATDARFPGPGLPARRDEVRCLRERGVSQWRALGLL